jgi:hypothetical protein
MSDESQETENVKGGEEPDLESHIIQILAMKFKNIQVL